MASWVVFPENLTPKIAFPKIARKLRPKKVEKGDCYWVLGVVPICYNPTTVDGSEIEKTS